MTEVITARMIIPVAIPTIFLLIDGLSIRLGSWISKLFSGSRAEVKCCMVGDEYANSAPYRV
jgi:hypothetical protein